MKNLKKEIKEKFELKMFLVAFFRPNKWKIIILFILIIVALLSTGRYACYGGTCTQPQGLEILYKFLIIMDNKLLEKLFSEPVILILEIIYLYIISCLSYFITYKIKENVKNK